MTEIGTNWAGNVAYGAERLAAPTSVDELTELVASASKARVVGTRHSFNRIADTDGLLISTAALPADIVIDADARSVTVSSGVRYGDLGTALEAEGWAVGNLASLPHISVAGAIATGTHGSGDRVGNLSSAVAALEVVTAQGEVVRIARGDADFDGAVVALGALGVLTRVTLDIEPSFGIAQTVYEGLPWESALADLDSITGAGYSTSLFTTWQSADVIDQVWAKRRSESDTAISSLAGAGAAAGPRHPLPGISAVNCTEQQGVSGRWLDRLPHFKLGFTPSNGEELQSEYLVPRRNAVAALNALRGLAAEIRPLIQVTEVRTMAADQLWLSPAFGSETVGLHFTWLPDEPAVLAFLPTLEAALEPFDARPHWGKVFTMDGARVASLYPRFADFAALRERFDPRGVFRNPYLERLGL